MNTVEDITQETDKNPSIELIMKATDMATEYSEGVKDVMIRGKDVVAKRDEQIQSIMNDGRQEGVSNDKIRDLIETELKKVGLSDRTIRRALPDELKQSSMIRDQSYRSSKQVEPPKQMIVPPPIPVPDKPIPVVEERLPLPSIVEEPREIAQDPSTTKPVVPPQKREQVIQCPLKVMSRGIAYQAWITVRISIPEHKVKLDPIDRMDIVKA